MAKWSDKTIAAGGRSVETWNTCQYCNCKEGGLHDKFCPTQLTIDPNWPYKVSVKEEEDDACHDFCNGTCDCAAPDNGVIVNVKDGYYPLFAVLNDALNQAQIGKGAERHADGQPFTEQPVLSITRAVGLGFPLGQAMKKIQECQRMDADAAKRELLGAINYLAAAILYLND